MRTLLVTGLAVVVAVVAAFLATSAGASDSDPLPPSRVVTLYHFDPLWQSISLRTGQPGHVFSDHSIANHQSDLDFGHYHEGEFSAGIEGGREGVILDLGPAGELATRHGISETVGGGQAYASIRFEEKTIVIGGRGDSKTQPIPEAEALFLRTKKPSHAKVAQNHIYLVRLTDRHEAGFDRIAKMLVISHDPQSGTATIRWDLLRDTGGRRIGE